MKKFEFVKFENGVVIVNTTPHPATIQDMNGDLKSVPSSCLINAKAVETQIDDLFVKTNFVGDDAGRNAISEIKAAFDEEKIDGRLIIIGSIIAAQAYPGEVLAMCPVPGYERVAPAEKRMRCDKFTTF